MRLFLLLPLLLLTACITPRETGPDPAAQEALRQREQQRRIEEYQRSTQVSLQDSEQQLLDLQREVRDLRDELARNQSRDQEAFDQRLDRLEQGLRQLEARQRKDREEIVSVLSKRMSELMASQPRGGNSGGGGVHTVGPGETLSAIASAYGVSSRAIIQANNLSNPDRLRVGQKLRIP